MTSRDVQVGWNAAHNDAVSASQTAIGTLVILASVHYACGGSAIHATSWARDYTPGETTRALLENRRPG